MDLKKIDLELRALVQNSRLEIYEICTRIKMLHDNSRQYASAVGLTAIQAADRLRSYLDDFNVDLMEIATLLSVFPSKEQWNKPLRQMVDAAFKAVAQRDRSAAKEASANQIPKTRQKKTTRNAEMDEAKARIESYAELLHRRDEEIQQLQLEIEQLRTDKNSLIEKVKSLESKLRKERRKNRPAKAMG